MNLLDKFNNLKISNVTRISDIDRSYCEHYEDIYIKAVKAYEGFRSSIQALVDVANTNPFHEDSYCFLVNSSDDIRPIENRLEKLKKDFVNRLCWYFAGKYKVTISNGFIGKYPPHITYENILDEIFLQMNGFTFEEKAVNEIKNDMQNLVRGYMDKLYVQCKVNKLIFNNLYIVHYDDIFKRYDIGRYGTHENALAFYTALCNFDHQDTGIGELRSFMDVSTKTFPDLFCKYDFRSMQKLDSIRFYKNGRIDVEFKNIQYANSFLQDYCGVAVTEVA